jgi:two-component system CheB/CheR fusion protein
VPARDRKSVAAEVQRLQDELAEMREFLQTVTEEHETATEELQSANEEVQSANEELQSTNEELETSREEIQSSNEELATVNDELQRRNEDLLQANNDLNNLIASVQMPIVILGADLRMRRFTPAAEKLLNLIPTDVGRPLADIRLRFDVPGLEPMLLEVIESVTVKELEVQDAQGRWYLLRIRPYKTLDNRIEGVVLVFVDVDTLRQVGKP